MIVCRFWFSVGITETNWLIFIDFRQMTVERWRCDGEMEKKVSFLLDKKWNGIFNQHDEKWKE